MGSSAFFGLVAWLYYLSFLLLAGLLCFIALKGNRHRRHRARLRRLFLWLALSLLLWQLTLFLEVRTVSPAAWLWLGRLNYTAIVFAPYLALRFVQEVALKGTRRHASWTFWSWTFSLRAETGLLAVLTLLTPLIDAAERVEAGQAISTYGPLFPVYLLHVVGYLVAALVVALRERRRAEKRMVRNQLTLIGGGMLATGGIALVTNALLPYAWGDFRWCDIGALSTLLFLLAIAYATFVHRLFALRVVLRETLVYGILLAFVLGSYSSAVFVVSQYLTEGAGKFVQFAVLLIAFSFDPLRRFLEEKTDRLLFGPREDNREGRKQRNKRRARRMGGRLTLALLFPWRRP